MLGSLEKNIRRQAEKLKRAQRAAAQAHKKLARYRNQKNYSRTKVSNAKTEVIKAEAILREEETRLRIMQTSKNKQESRLRIARRDSSGKAYKLYPERYVTYHCEWRR